MSDTEITTTQKFVKSSVPYGLELSNYARTMQHVLEPTLQEDRIRLKLQFGIVQEDDAPLPIYLEAYDDEFSLFYLRGVDRSDLLVAFVNNERNVQVVGGTLAALITSGINTF